MISPKVTQKNYCHRFAMEREKERFPTSKKIYMDE